MKLSVIKILICILPAAAHSITLSQYKQQLINLSDADLWAKASTGLVGACRLNDARACASCACDYYAQTTYANSTGYNGLPFDPSNPVPGTGCFAYKGSTSAPCWSGWSAWGPYNICAPDLTTRGANIIRDQLSLSSDVCKLADYVASLTPPEGGTLNNVLKAGKIVWTEPSAGGKIDVRHCYAKIGKQITGPSGPIIPLVRQKASKCFKSYMRQRMLNASSSIMDSATSTTVSAPTVSLSSQAVKDAIKVGAMDTTELSIAMSEAYISSNIQALAETEIFDKNLLMVQQQLDSTPANFTNAKYVQLLSEKAWWEKAKNDQNVKFQETTDDVVNTAILDTSTTSSMDFALKQSLSTTMTKSTADEIANKLTNEILPAQRRWDENLIITNPDPNFLKDLYNNRVPDALLKCVLSTSSLTSANYDTTIAQMIPYPFKVPALASTSSTSTSVASTSTKSTSTTSTVKYAEPVAAESLAPAEEFITVDSGGGGKFAVDDYIK